MTDPEFGWEYGIMRSAPAPDMSGQPQYVQIVNVTFNTLEGAKNALKQVPALKGIPALVCKRPAPGPWLEVKNG